MHTKERKLIQGVGGNKRPKNALHLEIVGTLNQQWRLMSNVLLEHKCHTL